MPSRGPTWVARFANAILLVCLLAPLALAMTGCIACDEDEDNAKAQAARARAYSSSMQSPGAAPLQIEGTWQWPSLKVDYTGGHLMDPRIYPVPREGAGWTFTIIKSGTGYATASGGTVKVSGNDVTITEVSSDGDSISLTGEFAGNVIVGEVHMVIPAKTLASGVAQGAGEYEDRYTATRVE